MAKFKKGDRVICTKETAYIKTGAAGTVDENNSECPSVIWDDKKMLKKHTDFNKWCISEDRLKLINMNDNDKVETTVANIKAAHAKGCSTGKAMIEALFPKVFEKEEENEEYNVGDKFCHIDGKYGTVILTKIGIEEYALVNIDTGHKYGDTFQTLKDKNQIFSNCPKFFKRVS